MSKRKEIKDEIIDNGVDLKGKKASKLKKRQKGVKSVRKTGGKQSFIGFSGRLSLILFAIVTVISLLKSADFIIPASFLASQDSTTVLRQRK